MHVSTALDAIKKRGTFKAYKEAQEAYVEQREVAKQTKATLAILTAPTSKGKKDSKKASVKKPPEKEKAFQKTKEGTALADTSAPELCKEYQAVYNKASFAKETIKNKREAAAAKKFQFYTNLLSLDAK
jgi:hypothetical protein